MCHACLCYFTCSYCANSATSVQYINCSGLLSFLSDLWQIFVWLDCDLLDLSNDLSCLTENRDLTWFSPKWLRTCLWLDGQGLICTWVSFSHLSTTAPNLYWCILCKHLAVQLIAEKGILCQVNFWTHASQPLSLHQFTDNVFFFPVNKFLIYLYNSHIFKVQS